MNYPPPLPPGVNAEQHRKKQENLESARRNEGCVFVFVLVALAFLIFITGYVMGYAKM